jgi:hypothetical protein
MDNKTELIIQTSLKKQNRELELPQLIKPNA